MTDPVKTLREAAASPIDWPTINGERITLDTMADTQESRDANAQNNQQDI